MAAASNEDSLVYLGRIGRPHGVRGAFTVYPYADNWERFRELKRVILIGNRATVETNVRAVRITVKNVILLTTACDSPEDARAFVNAEIAIPEAERPKLSEGQYYFDQLVGLTVLDTEGAIRGTVIEVETYPANDVCIIEDESRQRRMIPMTGNIVQEIDLKLKRMTIRAIPGLLDD